MLAAQSSDLYANNLMNFITTLIAPTATDDNSENGTIKNEVTGSDLALQLDMEDEIQGALAVTHDNHGTSG